MAGTFVVMSAIDTKGSSQVLRRDQEWFNVLRAPGIGRPQSGSTAVATAEVVDQPLGGAVFGRTRLAADHARVDALAELLAELHAPLIEGIDAPDGALREHLVLVQNAFVLNLIA